MVGTSLLRAAWQADKKLPLVVALLIVMNLGIMVGMRYYLSPQVERLERVYIERQAAIRKGHSEERSPQGPQAALWGAKNDLQIFWQAIPPRTELTLLIGELFMLADEAGLAINQINYNPKELEGRPLLRYGLNFSVSGGYAQVKRFVYSLEQSERLIAIENVALSSAGEPEQGQVNLSLKLSTLFRMGEL
jgi:type IV pilus assembly protein PilO